jgi:hypothetical protein
MFGLGVQELLIIIIILAFFAIPVWLWGHIADKAGFSKGWGFIVLVPLVNIILLWVFAFARWPNLAPRSTEESQGRV